jgi:hypothetical protein
VQRLTINQFNYEPDIRTFVRQVLSVIEIDRNQVRVAQGSDRYLAIPAVDIVTGEAVMASDDPARWAELLPETIGYGDVEVGVETVADTASEAEHVQSDAEATEALSAVVRTQYAAHEHLAC